MYLINVQAFIEREWSMSNRTTMDCETNVLEFRNDKTMAYAILSYRWSGQGVSYKEMTKLAKIGIQERDQVRRRYGYRQILNSCEQAKRDRYEWLWVDACCIDRRNAAEVVEANNATYRWFENSSICYVYLDDVSGTSLPTGRDDEKYSTSNGWPEWFSRAWTLQEMIAPSNVQFFNSHWQPIGDKKTLSHTLSRITGVPQHILSDGLSGNRPCVAQIMSWAADRKTFRDEDRTYSLLGLLDVNMPMLYGEGEKAFHRLQLEIIRTSNDQSIFAWEFNGGTRRTGSILADDPSFFRDCNKMELMDLDEFVRSVKDDIPEDELRSVNEDQLGVYPITNRGIHMWLLLRPGVGSRSVFKALLPCRSGPLDPPVAIDLALWESNYYRYSTTSLWDGFPMQRTLQFRQLYLRYQEIPHRDAIFEINDSTITENGLTYCGTYPSKITETTLPPIHSKYPTIDTLMLRRTDPLYVKVYCDSRINCRFAVGFGQSFGQDWIHFVHEKPTSTSNGCSWEEYAREEYKKMLVTGPEHARSMVEISCVVWERTRSCGVKIEIFRYPHNGPSKWIGLDVERADDPDCDMGCLMIRCPWGVRYELLVDEVSMEFGQAPDEINLGDYGHITEAKDFYCEGNIFADFKSLTSGQDITPRQHRISAKRGYDTSSDYVKAHQSNISTDDPVALYKPLGLSLPRNQRFNLLLTSFSTQLSNRYLVTTVIQSTGEHLGEEARQSSHSTVSQNSPRFVTNSSSITTPLCIIAKPLVWNQNEDASSVSVD
ncbi:hypothetical protein V8B97DRAFT_17785 [Scleroderma yunnanense]